MEPFLSILLFLFFVFCVAVQQFLSRSSYGVVTPSAVSSIKSIEPKSSNVTASIPEPPTPEDESPPPLSEPEELEATVEEPLRSDNYDDIPRLFYDDEAELLKMEAAAQKLIEIDLRKMQRRAVLTQKIENPKCLLCGETVYAAEERWAAGFKWHSACFKCTRCGKMLDSINCVEHCLKLYCATCYQRKFGPRGYGFGGSFMSYG